MYLCRISIYTIQHDSDIVYNCFNNLPQSPGKILYAKFLRTDPYPISPHQVGSGHVWCLGVQTSPEENSLLLLGRGHLYGGFLKWWYPTTIGFPTKNDHFEVFWGYHHLRKPPYTSILIKKETSPERYWWPTCWRGESFAFCQREFVKKNNQQKHYQKKKWQKTQSLSRFLPHHHLLGLIKPKKAVRSPQLTRLPLWDEVNFRIIDVQRTLFLHVEFDRLNFVSQRVLAIASLVKIPR